MSRYIKEKNSKKQMQRVRDKKIIEEDPRHPPLSNAEKCWRYRERRRNAPTNSTSDCYLEITAAPDEAGPSTSAMQSCSEDYEMGLLIPTNKTRNASMRVERDTMTLQDTSASMKMALGKPPEMSTEITIKREIDINIEVEDHSLDLQIKTENVTCNNEKISLNEEVNIENNDHQYDNMPMELKQEVDFAFIPEKEITDETVEPLEDMKVESRQVDEEMEKETENRIVAITKTENIDFENGRVEVKQEILMEDDSLVSYDYPDFNDAGSMDSSDAAVLGNVETCLQVDGGSNSESVSTYDFCNKIWPKMKNRGVTKGTLTQRGRPNNPPGVLTEAKTRAMDPSQPQGRPVSVSGENEPRPSTSGYSKRQQLNRGRRIPLVELTTDNIDDILQNFSSGDEDEEDDIDFDYFPSGDEIDTEDEGDKVAISAVAPSPSGSVVRPSLPPVTTPTYISVILPPLSTPPAPFIPFPIRTPSLPASLRPVSPVSFALSSDNSNTASTPVPSARDIEILSPERTPYEFFRLLLTDDFIDKIVDETNMYGEYHASRRVTPRSYMAQWKPTTRNEMLVFLGLTLHTGTIKMARLKDYWSTKTRRQGILHIPCFGQIMSRNRYFMLLQAFHFARNPGSNDPPMTDRLYKIRPVIDYFNEKMDSVFSGRELNIDESMVLWRGRLAFGHFIQNKRNKYGMKVYVLAEPNGLALKFLLDARTSDSQFGGTSQSNKMVKNNLQEQTGLGNSLHMDKYNNSVPLTKHDNCMTGTLPKKKRLNSNPRNEMVKRFPDESICVLKWKDKREVLLICPKIPGNVAIINNRRVQTTSKPLIVAKYNNNTSGLDRMDHLLTYYPIERKYLKWYRKLAIHVFHMLLTNSLLLYNTNAPTRRHKLKIYDLRLDVIETLVFLPYDNRPSQLPQHLSSSGHFPKPTNRTEGAAKGARLKRLMCRHCKKKQTTTYYCDTCTPDRYGVIGLCPECFRPYHTSA